MFRILTKDKLKITLKYFETIGDRSDNTYL